MGTLTIPVRLSSSELAACALIEAAAALATSEEARTFLAALDANHGVWISVLEAAVCCGWTTPTRREAEFVMLLSRRAGQDTNDGDIEALIRLNHDVARHLAGSRNLDAICQRAQLAWRESGRSNGTQSLPRWLASELSRKGSRTPNHNFDLPLPAAVTQGGGDRPDPRRP
jgi:hypothetical protein